MQAIRGHLAESAAAMRGAFRNTGLRRVELAYLGAALALYANVVAVGVYAYHHGGATAVGLVMFARMGLAAVSAPFVASFADRFPQQRVMFASDVSRVAVAAGMAAAAAAHVPALVYVGAVLMSMLATAFRPAEAALIPQLAETPEELTAANVATSTIDSIGAFAGPAAGALLLALGGSTLAFLTIAVAYLWSLSFVARIPATERRPVPEHAREEHEGIVAGFRAVRGEPRLRLLVGLYSAQTLVAGAYGVLVVVVALQLLDLGNAGVGLLQAATGVGAIVGAIVSLVLVGRKRAAADLGIGLVCFGAPLVALAALPRTWSAVVALAILGIGNSVVDISAVTLIQRAAPQAVAARVFGLLEAALVGALGLGAVVTPLLVHLIGARGALIAAGALLPVLAFATRASLASVDAGSAVPEEQLAAISSVPFLDVLPLHRKEALARVLERVELKAGATLFTEGQPGDQLYILTRGAFEVDLRGGAKVEHAPAFVGEIALLRDVPRTATVRIVEDATLWALDGAQFLDAVSGHARSRTAADAVVASRGVAFSV